MVGNYSLTATHSIQVYVCPSVQYTYSPSSHCPYTRLIVRNRLKSHSYDLGPYGTFNRTSVILSPLGRDETIIRIVVLNWHLV